MRIQFKCSCGAEAMWCNDDDCQVDRDHVERYASEWLADHAKCREVTRVLTPGPDGVIGKVNISKLPRREPNFAFLNDQKDRPNPEKGCEHEWEWHPPSGVTGMPRQWAVCKKCSRRLQ